METADTHFPLSGIYVSAGTLKRFSGFLLRLQPDDLRIWRKSESLDLGQDVMVLKRENRFSCVVVFPAG